MAKRAKEKRAKRKVSQATLDRLRDLRRQFGLGEFKTGASRPKTSRPRRAKGTTSRPRRATAPTSFPQGRNLLIGFLP